MACPRSPQTSSISFESSGKEAWVLKMSKWSQGNRKWYSLCGFPCDSSFYVVFHSTSEGTGGILAWEYSTPYIAHWRWKVTTQEINDAEVVVFAGYKESLRCALFILFHCIVLYCILSISFHFISCYYILRSQQTDLPLGLLLSLYFFRNGDLGYTWEVCPKEESV